MAASIVSAQNSTIVRARQYCAIGSVRTAFRVLERTSPALGARWAERLWFTVPGSRLRNQPPPSGRRLAIRVDERRIVAETWGAGPLVYLVHGWGGRRAHLGALVGPLVAAGYRVVAFDAPSHGESEPGPAGRRRSTILELAQALAAVCAAEGAAHAVVAHSLGCMATAVAVRDGLPARRLAFVAPMAEVTPYTHQFARGLGFGERIRLRLVRRIERRVATPLSSFDVPAMARTMRTPPLLLVHDREDPETRWADSAAIARSWPGANLVTTTGLGHRRILRDPQVVADLVAFVDSDSPATRPRSPSSERLSSSAHPSA
jgi:pimeloyl-ACP methyl ester carboxylesterase